MKLHFLINLFAIINLKNFCENNKMINYEDNFQKLLKFNYHCFEKKNILQKIAYNFNNNLLLNIKMNIKLQKNKN